VKSMPSGEKERPQRVPILVYHHVCLDGDPALRQVGPVRASGVVSESDFRRQLDHVVEHRWTVISTSQLCDWLEGSASITQRSVVLHFDNGWRDVHSRALPIAREYGFSATAYVISDATEAASTAKATTILTATEGKVVKPSVTWDGCRDLLNAGWEIGAHTASHPRLAQLYGAEGEAAVRAEIEGSNLIIERTLGVQVRHFAYPSGSRNAQLDALLAGYYRSLRRWTFSQPPVWRFTDSETKPHALECQNVDNTVTPANFALIFSEAEQR